MNAPVTVAELADSDLQAGFASFVDAAHRLEQSYAELKVRADAIDHELAETNRRLEFTLAERERIFCALPVGVVARAEDGSVRWRNPEAERLIESVAREAADLLSTADGESRFGELTVRVRRVSLPEGGELVMLEDRSRVVELEGEVRRLDRLAGLSELALGIAHEIKNPLNGVVGFASLMERTEDPETLRRFGRKVAEGLRQVDGIVKAMLAFARPVGKESVPAAISAVVVQAAAEAGVPMGRVSTSGDLEVQVEGSALARVLGNLFRNSVDAVAASGQLQVHIDVEVRCVDGQVEIEVADDGPGIDPGLGTKVFEPFVSTKERGHGLGLALCARVLGFLDGSIELLNPGEVGARFVVCMPRHQLASEGGQ